MTKPIRRRKAGLYALASSGILALSVPLTVQALNIDTFDLTTQTLFGFNGPAGPDLAFAPEAIGGTREIDILSMMGNGVATANHASFSGLFLFKYPDGSQRLFPADL